MTLRQRLKTTDLLCLCSALLALSCGGEFTSSQDSGGAGGTSAGGTSAGGTSAGGTSAAGGSSGSQSGGSSSGGNSSGGSAAGGSGASGGSGGGDNSHWECQTNPDCGKGQCVQLAPSGFQACAFPVDHATECVGPEPDCCSDADCSGGSSCLVEPLSPFCGGAFPVERSVCAKDECASTADCVGNSICVPAGVFGLKVASCRDFLCTKDSDCSAEPGGKCAAVADPCCGVRSLTCVYPGGCFSQADCRQDEYCQPKPGGSACLPDGPICPG